MTASAPRPLDGITVVSLEHAIAAPFCTRQLADLGARVIKVERPEVGDFARAYDTRVKGLASHFVWTNRSSANGRCFARGCCRMRQSRDPRFDSNARRNEHRDALKAIVLAIFSKLTTQQVLSRLDAAQIANARMNDGGSVGASAAGGARAVAAVGSPAGDIPALLPPGRVNSFDYRMDPIPAVGQHTESILRELGQGDADIAALRQTHAI